MWLRSKARLSVLYEGHCSAEAYPWGNRALREDAAESLSTLSFTELPGWKAVLPLASAFENFTIF